MWLSWCIPAAELACQKLAALGYAIEEVSDSFGSDTRYKGVHAEVRAKDGETKLEVQFHTRESAEAKERTHPLYRVFRDPDVDIDERRSAGAEIAEVTSTVQDPPNRPDTLGGVQVQVKLYPLPADLR